MAKRTPTPNKPRPVDSLYRVVVPKEVREALKLDKGDYVIFKVEGKTARISPISWKERE